MPDDDDSIPLFSVLDNLSANLVESVVNRSPLVILG